MSYTFRGHYFEEIKTTIQAIVVVPGKLNSKSTKQRLTVTAPTKKFYKSVPSAIGLEKKSLFGHKKLEATVKFESSEVVVGEEYQIVFDIDIKEPIVVSGVKLQLVQSIIDLVHGDKVEHTLGTVKNYDHNIFPLNQIGKHNINMPIKIETSKHQPILPSYLWSFLLGLLTN